MPEGDAVRLTARRLDRGLKGRRLVATDFRWPSLATVDLTGATVLGTGTHGKHLLTRFDHDGRLLTLHTHLKMEGRWRVHAAGARWSLPARDARVVLRTEATEAVGFSLAIVELLPTADETSVIGHLGPDLLADGWDEEEALRRLLADPARPLGEALLDQTVVAGIGTIYLSEVCFAHGVHPLTPVGEVRDPLRLLRRAGQMLRIGVANGRPVMTGDRREPLWVYRRHRLPCRRCATTVEAGPVGDRARERTTYWCPSCQPLPEKSL
ncbi:Fpg/Nei family DNA glycosylase (plasmid) [Georgenia sp. TF02-10]|uniref:DNA-formamidopyrimidine glycosylase family protein n=1 Tax=Georgenia sp. TF02-10 TaxID=2917725 RepID=UPI001FA7F09B|nr:DNA-formamidopyrimidine glycosylase family protein [Georgenia sp. TF02-10]UNX56563.1 Fpg/Nei family DNA glycosylase [Georgenia sp. TF02-10]